MEHKDAYLAWILHFKHLTWILSFSIHASNSLFTLIRLDELIRAINNFVPSVS